MNVEHSKYHGNLEPALRVLAMPRDTNPMGDIFGGWIMSQVDMAGAVVASQLVKSRVVTVAVNEFTFKHPVLVGDIISCYGKVVKKGRTSVTVDVEVCALRNRFDEKCIKVTEATVVYVAIDDKGKPKTISDIGNKV
ncbi:MAG: acyl-CoA thioesterase [Calditrichia bacterium]|nr:acyl-CoA thioesterase [Calditrichia bacterium]